MSQAIDLTLPMPADAYSPDMSSLAARFARVRLLTTQLAAPLSAEDAMLQSMDDASPAKWHLAHSTWFFERFVLAARPGYRPMDARWDEVFNSYYNGVGPVRPRSSRGLLSRPSLADVLAYRVQVDAGVMALIADGDVDARMAQVLLLGTHHEQQHQELLLTDIKHAFWSNPLHPAYRTDLATIAGKPRQLHWLPVQEAIYEMGAGTPVAPDDFAFDNELPMHRVLIGAHALSNRPASNAEFRAFIDDGGYGDANLWLSDGWDRVQRDGWERPLYWDNALAREFTLGGWREIDPHAPVCHVSYYEADAFARWAGARLPTEAEWERSARARDVQGNFADDGLLHPAPCHLVEGAAPACPQTQAPESPGMQQMFGDVWEWTSSAYTAYPGFQPLRGTLGEYNGKFMCGPWVLRGGSCATPRDHVRASYRNFFSPWSRWQFSGIRLARGLP